MSQRRELRRAGSLIRNADLGEMQGSDEMTDWNRSLIRLAGAVLFSTVSGCMHAPYQSAFIPGTGPEMAGSTVGRTQAVAIPQSSSSTVSLGASPDSWAVGTQSVSPGMLSSMPANSSMMQAGFAAPSGAPSTLSGAYYSVPAGPVPPFNGGLASQPVAQYPPAMNSQLPLGGPRFRADSIPNPLIHQEPAMVPMVHAEPMPEPRFRPVPVGPAPVRPESVAEARVRPAPATAQLARVEPAPIPAARVRPDPASPVPVQPELLPEARNRPSPASSPIALADPLPEARNRPVPAISPLGAAEPTPDPRTRPAPVSGAVPARGPSQAMAGSGPFDDPAPKVASIKSTPPARQRVLASDHSLAWAEWPFTKSTVPAALPSAERFSSGKALLPYRVATRPGSQAEKFYRTRMAVNTATASALNGPGGAGSIARPGLQYRGGRTLLQLAYLNLYIGGEGNWQQQDVLKIDSALQAAMNDERLNAQLAPYFDGKTVSTVALPSHPLPGPIPEKITRADIHRTLQALHAQGYFEDYDLQDTVFNFLCPTDTVLADDVAEMNSLAGLSGYHGSLPVEKETIYYTVVIAGVRRADGTENGIPVFPEGWKNTTAALYHQLQKVRTNPDCEDVLRAPENPESSRRLGWTADSGDEIGDLALRTAGSLEAVIQEVALADGSGTVPVQFLELPETAKAETTQDFALPVTTAAEIPAIPAAAPAEIPAIPQSTAVLPGLTSGEIPSEIPPLAPARTESPAQANPFP